MTQKWTKAEVKALISLWKKGLTTKIIAETLGRTTGSVRMKVHGLQKKGELKGRTTTKGNKPGRPKKMDKPKSKMAQKYVKDIKARMIQLPNEPYIPIKPVDSIEYFKKYGSHHESSVKITSTISEIQKFLLQKNRQYGDSALNPIRVFAKSDETEQLRVRIDDKLNRLIQGDSSLETDEDVIKDLIGYLILLLIQLQE